MDTESERLLDSAPDEDTYSLSAFASQHNLSDALPTLQIASQLLKSDIPFSEVETLSKHDIAALQAETTHKWHQPLRMYLCISVTAFGAMGQGWAQTGINGANLYFPSLVGIGSSSPHDTLIVGIINAGIYLSNGLLGCWLVAPLNARLGRRGAVFVGALTSLVFNVAGSLASNWQTLLFCRLVLGLGLAIITGTLNVFQAEAVPAYIRGGLGISWQMFCAFGIFLGFLTNMLVDDAGMSDEKGDNGWRVMLFAAALPTIPLLALIYLCPESPSWLIKTSERYNEAYKSLCLLRNSEIQAAKELVAFYAQQTQHKRRQVSPQHNSLLTQLSELFTILRIQRATIAAYTTMFAQILCGINIVAFYSSSIFVGASFSNHAAEAASTIFGALNTIGAVPAIWAMDSPSWGRRSLLLYSLPPMAVTLAIAGLAFALPDSLGGLRFVLSTSMIYTFCLLYSPGLGPVPAAYSAEVFPLSHRELGMSTSVSVANFAAAILSLTFPYLLSVLGTSGAFLLYAVLNLVAWCLVFLLMPETKCKTLAELDDVFNSPLGSFVKDKLREAKRIIHRERR